MTLSNPSKLKSVVFVFLISFFLNLIWENLHSFFYDVYKGEVITEFILIRATLGDAVMLTILFLPFLYLDFFKKRLWLIIPIGLALAIKIELFAMMTNRWTYNEFMPIIPYLNVGLTPTIQLALLGYVTYRIVLKSQPN
jgi:hypothetical protein